jgi:hypothetical protein
MLVYQDPRKGDHVSSFHPPQAYGSDMVRHFVFAQLHHLLGCVRGAEEAGCSSIDGDICRLR